MKKITKEFSLAIHKIFNYSNRRLKKEEKKYLENVSPILNLLFGYNFEPLSVKDSLILFQEVRARYQEELYKVYLENSLENAFIDEHFRYENPAFMRHKL